MTTLSQCRHCTIRNLCGGGCEVDRISSDQSSRQQMCQFFKMEWENILYIYSELQD
ncbi:MAG: hypothetical protein LBU84_17655 [Prevotella sp.]|nr:hypothetical protein [Prevotella sp.]